MDKLKELWFILVSIFYDPIVKLTYDKNEILTIYRKSGEYEQYHGECTVWSTYPMMYNVNSFKQGELYRYWKLCTVKGIGEPKTVIL